MTRGLEPCSVYSLITGASPSQGQRQKMKIELAIVNKNGEVTTGFMRHVAAIGDLVTIEDRDENGLPVKVTGRVLEILTIDETA